MPMSCAEIWEAWAPADVLWSQWAKPVLIAQLAEIASAAGARLDWQSLDLSALPRSSDRTALVVELPGALSISYGLALAKRGFRPVPLFNGCVGRAAVVPTEPLQAAMVTGAMELQEMTIDSAAPPAFLLDAHRLRAAGSVRPGQFDNRWMTFPQDFPSGALLKSQLIESVVLLQDEEAVDDDLAHVLLRWKESGVRIMLQNRGAMSKPRPLNVLRPPRYRALWHRALAALGLRRNSAGGFGSLIPEPSPEGGYRGGMGIG
jgi:hypothetical protein